MTILVHSFNSEDEKASLFIQIPSVYNLCLMWCHLGQDVTVQTAPTHVYSQNYMTKTENNLKLTVCWQTEAGPLQQGLPVGADAAQLEGGILVHRLASQARW